MKKKLTPYLLLVPQLILSLLFLIGLITGIIQSLGVIPVFGLTEPTLEYYKEVLTKPDMMASVAYSLHIAFASAIISTVGGVIVSAAIISSGKMKKLTMSIVNLPVIIPHVVVALFTLNICAQNGILARICHALGFISDSQQFPLIVYNQSGLGVILAYIWKELPFIVFFVIAMMANINSKLGEAAVNLGASPFTAFRRVTLPLCKNTILSGFLIIFVFALGAYEMPVILGTTLPKALPVLAYQQFVHPDLRTRPLAMALNGIIIIISVISAIVYFVLMEKSIRELEKGGRK